MQQTHYHQKLTLKELYFEVKFHFLIGDKFGRNKKI
jgi:hypothetical protein